MCAATLRGTFLGCVPLAFIEGRVSFLATAAFKSSELKTWQTITTAQSSTKTKSDRPELIAKIGGTQQPIQLKLLRTTLKRSIQMVRHIK